jgi:hypothetical protein
MNRLSISYRPLSNGKFVDLRCYPIPQWVTVIDSGKMGLIVIDGILEASYHRDEIFTEISWREYFSWLAGLTFEEGKKLTWNELRKAVEMNLAGIFGCESPLSFPASPCEQLLQAAASVTEPPPDSRQTNKTSEGSTKPTQLTQAQLAAIERQKYRDICGVFVPHEYLPPAFKKEAEHQQIFEVELN